MRGLGAVIQNNYFVDQRPARDNWTPPPGVDGRKGGRFFKFGERGTPSGNEFESFKVIANTFVTNYGQAGSAQKPGTKRIFKGDPPASAVWIKNDVVGDCYFDPSSALPELGGPFKSPCP